MAWERGGRRPLVALVLFLAMSSRVKADNMEVKRLQSTDGAQLSIYCATTNGVIPEETTDHYELIFINPQNDEVTLTSTSEVLDNPQVFDLDLQGLYGSQTVFVLTLKDSQSDKASIDMTFSLEDMSSVKATWVGTKEQGKPGSVLRLHGHGSDVLVCPAGEDKTGCLAFPSDANYREASDLSGASALVCARMEEDPTVPFCLAVADVTTSPAISYHSEIRLSYQEDQTAAPEGTLSVAMGIDSGDKRDLLYWADGNLYVCAGTSSCKIEAYPSSSDQYEVFFVDYQEVDGEVSKASTVIPFIDFVVVGTVIGPDALEVRWKTNSHLQYKLSLTDNNGNDIETNPPPPFTSLVVHCASQEDCFGYFLELPAGDYKVMVRPWNGVDQIMSNSVLSSQQTIIQKSENKISDLEIQDVHFGWSSDGSKAFASACFTNKGGTPRSLRQFELVIADLKGHSIRSRGATQKADGAICFVGVTLLSDELIPGKVVAIVIERDFDGLSVVASASTEAFFKRTFDLTITQFEIVDETTKEFSIRYTGVSATVSGGELSAIKLEPEPVTEMDLALTGVSDTGANFVGTDLLMTWLQGQEPLKWVLRLTTEVGTMFGEVEFLFPVISNFPKCDPGYLVGKQQMVRLDCNEQSLETDAILVGGDDLAIQASTGVKGVNYHLLNQPATSAAHIQLCRKAEDNPDVEICTRRSELKDATANAAAMTAIQVEYEATISVEQTPSDKKALDSLVYYYHNDPDSTTIKSCREPDVQNCLVPEYIGVEELEVLVVYVDDTKGKPVESEQRTVYGLELRGAQISDSLSEIAIKKMPDRNAYRVIVLETSQGTGVEAREPILNVKVTCENPLCYAYFSHLTAGVKYKATVSPYEDKEGTGNLDLMNQIVSLEMSTTQYRGKRGAANPKELILKRINRVKADTTKFSTDITVSNGADAIDGIASVTLIATHDNGDGTEEEYVAISQDVDSGTISPNADQVYHFDINPADTILSPKTTLILIAKDAENVPLALAEATVELQTINPTMSWVGGEDTAPLRVSTDQKLEINEIEFDAGTSYSLDFDAAAAASPVEVCVTLENAAPAGGTVRQCDLTQSIQNVEHTKVEKIELQSEEGGKSDMTVWSTFKAMEAVLYNEEDTGIVLATFSCNTANVCTSDISSQIPGLEQVFKVLVVGVNETDVPWADVVDFENFQTRVQRISDSDVEVRWEASEMLDFNVHLENNNQDGFAIVPVQCGGADLRNCKAYFTKLEADTPYKAGVMKDNTVVSISVPTTAGTTPPLSISRLTKVSKHPAQMKLTFSAEVEVAGIEYVEYVVIDPPVDNTAMQHIIFKDTNEIINVGENEISFDEAELPDSGEGATVLVIVHGPDGAASDALAAGKVVGTFKAINPTMSWVGGEDAPPLRVSTDQKLEINGIGFDNGTSYSLDFDAAAAASPVEVCVTLENAAPAGGTVRQCDLTQSIQSVGELAIDKIELNYDDEKNFMTVSSTFAGMEAVLYNAGGSGIIPVTFSCATENTCSSDNIISDISSLKSAFKVLVVGVDAETVTGSKVADFEDFKVRVQRFSDAGDLEVRWRASSNQSYEVHLDNEVPDGFTSVSAQCGGAGQAENRACKAYFTKLKPDTTYKAQLERENTVVSATVPATPGPYTPATITRIAEMSKSPSKIQFTISAAAEVAGIEYVEYVVIDPPVDNMATQHIIFKKTNENITVGDNVITFDTELPNVGAEGTVLVVVHGSGGVDSDALAAAKVVVTFEVINPTMTWVGGQNTAPVRIKSSQDLTVNGDACDAGTSYSLVLDASAAPPELCVALENTAAGGTVWQCDVTQSIQNTDELTIDKIELNYDDGKNFMTVSSTFAGMEAVLYNAGGSGIMPMTYSCVAEDTKTCSSVDIIDHISSLEPAFKVLVVGVEAETVTGAKVADFEDFKVRVQRFSDAGDLEVRWRASSDQSFKVHLDNEVPDGFTSVSLQCGGAGQAENRACKAYFTKLKPDTTYKVQLEKDNTVVSATVPATPGHSTAIHITQIAKASLDPLQTQLTVTADTEVMGMEYVEYVMIDLPSGDESTQYIVFKDMHGVINVDNSITFDVEQVPNTGVEVTILFIVHRKDGVDSDALAAGKVALTFEEIKPKMNWVGGTSKPPLRIQTTQELEVNGIHVDKGTFYFLDFDGSVSAPEVCVTRETIVPAGGTVKQCDMTLTKGNVPDMDVNKIELNHEEDKSTMTVYSTFTNMEAVLYDADDRGKVSESFSCNTENVCSSDVTTTLSGLETAFKVLAVGVDGQSDVTGAKLVDFEDFQTRAQKFGDAGDVEVRWRTSTPQQFNVSLENDVDDGYTNVSVECGGAEKAGNRACKAYYTKLKPGKTYKAEVKKDIAVVSASVTSPSGSVQALSITRISEVSKAPRQTQLTITAEEEVTGIEYLEYVMIDPPEGGEATEHIAINDTTDTIGVGNTTVTFSETDEPIMYEEETLLVLAHGPDTNILASGKVLMYFADLEPPKMTKVGSEELQSLKVETSDLDAKVNGELCRAKSVCYFLESEILEPPEVCRGGEPFVEQCDMTGSYILPKNLINPMVDLKYSGIPQEELTVTAEFDAASVSMEAMIYSDDGIDTSTPLTCNIKGKECVFTVVPPRPLFKILLMALNHQADVVESHATKFEDFQTRAEQVMDGTVEVSWKASQTMVYAIEIRPPPETSYSKTTVTCGGENPEDSKNCMAYFMGLNPGEGYTVYVTKEVDGSQSVSAFVQLETRDFSSPITITTVKKNADKRPSLSVCFKDELLAEGKSSEGVTGTRNLKYSLAVVNPLGQQLHSTLDLSSLSSHSNLEDDLCFSALSLGLDFDVRQKVWVFVKREGKSDGRVGAAGDVEVSLLAEIAEVSEVKAKATGFDKILVTWQKPEDEDDVSSYVITWTKASPSSKASLTDRSIQPRPRQPLPLIAQGFRESEQEQRVVPASYPSAEVLHLDPSQVYEVCVSAVRRGVEGGRMCDVNDLGKYDPVQSPTDLVFEDDLLKWKEVTSASGYLVEWRPRQEGVYSGGQAEVRTPSWHAGSLSPGRWVVSVRATTDTSASKPESAEYLRNGIEIVSAVQSKNNQLVLQWREEPEPPCAESTCNYTITTSRNKGPTWHSCSGLKDGCEKAVRVEGGSQVEVILERGGLRTSVKERVYRFPEVSGLSQRFAPGDKEVTMSWAEVEEAKLYNVTLYTDSTLSSIRFTAMINKESLNLRENNVTGNVLVIQPCADKDHCGNCQNITLMAIADSPSSNTPVVAASVVGGILLVVSVVFLVVVVKTIMKRREDEDTSPLEEVGGVPPMSAQQSAHSVAHRVIPLSTLSLQENKQE
ncbi:uncharacterized protein LOC122249732 isoform X1 [Penaeus japonicus]|uniref:uncharacterized protein LOC122249732 isoform X1 n=1 Tax=Penaeus japonicus TaxID=27405 RepID=UPI001C717A3C|nr:uncharacterized protein LOC122249732 isoform X1 [Penaeus japonicus]